MVARMGLENKVVLITGAARGIGAETARRAVARGARVSLVGLEPDRLRALAGELGERAAWFEADVTDQAQLEGAVAGTVAAFGGVDIVLANAGVGNSGTVAITPPEILLRTIEINLDGVVRTVCATLPHVTQRRGYVMIVSSTAAFTMAPGMAPYAASKAAVEQFANCLRLEVAHKGVAVGSVHPGWIDTDLVREQRKDIKTFDDAFEKFPWPLNATTSVEECADAIVAGMERRKRRVYVPRAIALVQALRTLTTGAVGYLAMRREAKAMVPRMEAEVQALGRYYGSSSVAMPASPPALQEAAQQPAGR
jgi:NAD(P)-dependent dehydrogenase (short-subunit alcohol dehydrogenase family)